METIVVAIIGIVAAILAGVLGRPGQAGSGAASPGVDPVARVAALVGGVLGLTAVVLVVMVSTGPLQRLEDAGRRLEDLGHLTVKSTKTLADFAAAPEDIGAANQLKALTADAKAILDGNGPQVMTAADRRWAVGDVVYVNEGQWVTPLHPQGRRDRTTPTSESCGIEPTGALTIRGFSEPRRVALLQYTPPGAVTSGTRCPAGTYFFYRVK
jgi:hypothetical protein